MLKISKKFLFFAMMIISSVSLINIIVLYWFPVQIPLSSYSVTGLAFTAYFLKAYYLLPICLSICIIMFVAAFSFLKERAFLPVASSLYVLCDFIALSYSFFGAWFKDGHFITVQAIQMLISFTVIVFLHFYFAARKAVIEHN
jgi:hypothetical protein